MAQGRKHKTKAQQRFDAENNDSVIPRPTGRCPKVPIWLAKEAKTEWKRVAKPLHKCGLLDSVDRAALAMYCASWAIFVESSALVARDGCTVMDGDTVRSHPAHRAMAQSLKDCMSIAGQIGLTANARLRMGTSFVEPDDPQSKSKKKTLEGYMNGG